MEARVLDVNLTRWTVDVVTQFDQKYYLNVQVGSPYMNPTRGEGIYAVPEIGSKCLVCIPSDGPPPFIISFIMPQETNPDTRTDDAPNGVSADGKGGDTGGNSDAVFSGGRIKPKPGDIYIKGRDGNFCILHRGGVLQIGSTALSQRIYIPLGNMITDISQNYHHYNTGGSINWAVSTGESETNPGTYLKQSFRLFANEEKATIRIATGTFKDPIGLTPGAFGANEVTTEQIGRNEPIIYEVTVAPEKVEADTGSPSVGATSAVKLQFAFDKDGGAYLWGGGSIVLATKKKLVVRAKEGIDLETEGSYRLKSDGANIDGGPLLELVGSVVRIGAGTKPVAFQGSAVTITAIPTTPLGIIDPNTGGVVVGPLGLQLTGTVTQGNPNVRV